jgi:hypothetical protein
MGGLAVVGKALGTVALGWWPPSCSWSLRRSIDRPMLARWALLVAMCACTLVIMLAVDIAVRHALVQERMRTDVMLEAERHRMEEILERIAGLFAARERPLRSVDDSH